MTCMSDICLQTSGDSVSKPITEINHEECNPKKLALFGFC